MVDEVSRPEFDALDRLREELLQRGHDAEHVPNSPVDLLNVWLDGKGRNPHATIAVEDRDFEDRDFVWGHQWQYRDPTTQTEHAATEIERTMRDDQP